MLVRELRHARDVEHVEARIAERFAEQEPRGRTDGGAPGVEVARIDERRLDAEARQRVVEQVVRAAVERARRDDVVARAQQAHDGEVQRRLPARGGDRADAAFERGDALLEHGAGRIGDPRIDVPRPLHVEQRRGMVAVGEHERCRLVDRRRPRAGRGIRPARRRAATACRSAWSWAWSSAAARGAWHGGRASRYGSASAGTREACAPKIAPEGLKCALPQPEGKRTMQRKASARWQGTTQEGSGTLSVQSGTLKRRRPIRSRHASATAREPIPRSSSPPPMPAASRWRCRSRSTMRASPRPAIETEARLTMDTVDGKPTITAIHLTTSARRCRTSPRRNSRRSRRAPRSTVWSRVRSRPASPSRWTRRSSS